MTRTAGDHAQRGPGRGTSRRGRAPVRLARAGVVLALLSTVVSAEAPAPAPGYWHASGAKLVDASGAEVRFSGVNFGGFESENHVLQGTWGGIGRHWTSYLDQIRSLGFSVIRVPFAGDTFTAGQLPSNIDYGANPDLSGKTTLEILDLLVAECGKRGLRIILDYHRIQSGSTPEDGLWYVPGSSTFTEQHWIDTWKMLAGRYAGNPTVIGCDLFNEVHAGATHPGPFWSADGADEPYNWRTAAKRAAEAILSVNPDVLICVQGMDQYAGQGSWWGANLMGLADHPFDISKPSAVVYEVHDYGPNVYEQPWHDDPSFPSNLPSFWDAQWGFVHDRGIGPVWIGEWGSRLDSPKERQWATALRDYIAAKGLSWTWWTWAPTSPDTGGILEDDWKTPWPEKLALIAPVHYAAAPDANSSTSQGGCSTAPTHRVAASAVVAWLRGAARVRAGE